MAKKPFPCLPTCVRPLFRTKLATPSLRLANGTLCILGPLPAPAFKSTFVLFVWHTHTHTHTHTYMEMMYPASTTTTTTTTTATPTSLPSFRSLLESVRHVPQHLPTAPVVPNERKRKRPTNEAGPHETGLRRNNAYNNCYTGSFQYTTGRGRATRLAPPSAATSTGSSTGEPGLKRVKKETSKSAGGNNGYGGNNEDDENADALVIYDEEETDHAPNSDEARIERMTNTIDGIIKRIDDFETRLDAIANNVVATHNAFRRHIRTLTEQANIVLRPLAATTNTETDAAIVPTAHQTETGNRKGRRHSSSSSSSSHTNTIIL